jgi:hypothetical protein
MSSSSVTLEGLLRVINADMVTLSNHLHVRFATIATATLQRGEPSKGAKCRREQGAASRTDFNYSITSSALMRLPPRLPTCVRPDPCATSMRDLHMDKPSALPKKRD